MPSTATGSSTDRMFVPSRANQFAVMIRAVQNLTPQAIVMDEIGMARQVVAARDVVPGRSLLNSACVSVVVDIVVVACGWFPCSLSRRLHKWSSCPGEL